MPTRTWHERCWTEKEYEKSLALPGGFWHTFPQMKDTEITQIAWEDICDMEIEGRFPDLYLQAAWHAKEDRPLTEGELRFVDSEYSSAIYETVFNRY